MKKEKQQFEPPCTTLRWGLRCKGYILVIEILYVTNSPAVSDVYLTMTTNSH